jgi:ABC-type uncharacterized transport system substrate-binding protein
MQIARLSRVIRLSMLIAAVFVSGAAAAHPHVWIKYSAQLRMHGTSVLAIKQMWRFTEGFPVQLVGIDALPDNGVLNAKQTAIFREQAFASLAGAQYFSHLFVDGQPQQVLDPDDFRVSVEQGKVVYTFTLKLAKPVNVTGHQVALGIWDDSFFVDYEPDAAQAITLDGAAPTCTAKPFADRAHPIFNGIVVPQATAISC